MREKCAYKGFHGVPLPYLRPLLADGFLTPWPNSTKSSDNLGLCWWGRDIGFAKTYGGPVEIGGDLRRGYLGQLLPWTQPGWWSREKLRLQRSGVKRRGVKRRGVARVAICLSGTLSLGRSSSSGATRSNTMVRRIRLPKLRGLARLWNLRGCTSAYPGEERQGGATTSMSRGSLLSFRGSVLSSRGSRRVSKRSRGLRCGREFLDGF